MTTVRQSGAQPIHFSESLREDMVVLSQGRQRIVVSRKDIPRLMNALRREATS
jgi:hypothetical protein